MALAEIALVSLAFIVLLFLAYAIKIAREYERMVIFRLGRFSGVKGPGLFLIIPIVDKKVLVDLRILATDVPKQRAVTRDNVSVEVDAVVYYRVDDPERAVIKIQNFIQATNLLAQTTLRDILGQVELDVLLSRRDELNKRIQEILDIATDPWGVKVSAVTIRDVSLPESMVRAIAKQAEAERERRSRIIMAEGEFQAAQKMREAAELYAGHPAAMKLRELQTLAEISRERNMIIVTPTRAMTDEDVTVLGTATGVAKKVAKEESEP